MENGAPDCRVNHHTFSNFLLIKLSSSVGLKGGADWDWPPQVTSDIDHLYLDIFRLNDCRENELHDDWKML